MRGQPLLLQIWDAAHAAMVRAFGSNFSRDQDLRSRLAQPLDTSQIQTPRISAVPAGHQVSSGTRVASGHRSSQSRSGPSRYPASSTVQQTPLPSEGQRPLQRAMMDLPTHSPTMNFNDYLKLHNQIAPPLPFGQANESVYAAAHGVIPNPSAAGYSPPAQQRHSHARTWSNATSSHRSSGTTAMARGDTAGDSWSYHPGPFPSGPPGEGGSHGDQGAAPAPSLQTHPDYGSLQQMEEPGPSSTASSQTHQTWEQLVRELGLPV